MRRFSLAILFLILSLFPQTVFSEDPELYSDVGENHVYKDAIEYMTEAGHVEGYEDGTFQPMAEINRAEALKIIMNVSKVEEVTLAEVRLMDFPDLAQDAWYYSHIEQAYQSNIVDGHDDGYFKPEDPVNRAEALKMFFEARNIQFEETEPENWYDPYLDLATDKNLIVPVENSYTYHPEQGPVEYITEWDYLPGQNLTRGELCDIIYRYMNAPFTGEIEFGKATYYGYSYDGVNTSSGTPLEAYGFMAAHKTLPFHTWVRVTNLANNLSVDVEIVDRGPYGEGRVIDLTPYAFEQIGLLSTGILNSRVEVLQ